MEQINFAHNLQEAEIIAFNHVRNNLNDKAGYVSFPVEHNIEVLINHQGKIPIHSPNGWNFYFTRGSAEDAWQLINTEEY